MSVVTPAIGTPAPTGRVPGVMCRSLLVRNGTAPEEASDALSFVPAGDSVLV